MVECTGAEISQTPAWCQDFSERIARMADKTFHAPLSRESKHCSGSHGDDVNVGDALQRNICGMKHAVQIILFQ